MKQLFIISILMIFNRTGFGCNVHAIEQKSEKIELIFIDRVKSDSSTFIVKQDTIYMKSGCYYKNNEKYNPGFLNR